MLSSLKRKYLVNTKTNAITFLAVFALILLGYFIGLKPIGFGLSQITSIVVFSVATIALFIWSFSLYTKAQNYEKTISNQSDEIQKEVEKRENAIQELNATHQQLSSTSGYLERIIQESSDLITAVDKDFRYISFNNSFKESMKGFFKVDVEAGVKLDDILAEFPKELKQAKEYWTRSFEGESFTSEQFFTDISGKLNVFELRYSPIKDRRDKIIGASQIARNVTKKKLEAEQLKRERDFASAIFDVNKSLILVLNRDGMIVRFNKACELVSGYTEEEIKGRLIWNLLIPAEDISKLKTRIRNCDFENLNAEYTSRWITKDENLKHISWQISATNDEHGIHEFIVATGIDITESRDIEIAQQRLLEILENSTDHISISNPQGQLIYLNTAGRKMLGLTEETNVETLKTTSFYPEWVNEILQNEALPQAYKEGTWIGETAIKISEKEEIPTSQLIMAHRNELNDVEFYSTVIRDTSYRSKIRRELAEVKVKAFEKNKFSSDFLAKMSHEIRTPMNGVVGLSELLLKTKLTDEQKDYIESIKHSGDSLLNIINDILDYSKLEVGKLRFENEDFDLYKTIESTLDLFANDVQQKQLELILHIDKDVPNAVRGDSGRLRQVLINFISNAVKFTDKGEIILRVKLENDANAPTIHFSFVDTGIGISANSLRRLFKPYIQADITITNKYGGTGLGLAISKQLITLMNGDLGATSELGFGSTFWFTATFEKQTNGNQMFFSHESLKNVSTLIVAENAAQTNSLQTLTKSWGMVPDVANTGETALVLLNNAVKNGENFEVVLVDAALPKMERLTLVKKIKAENKLRKTKIILLLPQIEKDLIDEANDIGIKHFVIKPIQQTKLFHNLIDIMTGDKISEFDDTMKNITIERVSEGPFDNAGSNFENEQPAALKLEVKTNQNILIAEDNLVNQKVIMNQVSGLGYQVDLVKNGKEVIDALRAKDYSLILMDCQMPVMDGFGATKEIRQNENLNSTHIPIIAVTAHAIEGDREKCLSVGMDDYISKPTNQKVLANAISFWLNKSTHETFSKEGTFSPVIQQENNLANSESENISNRLIELEESCGEQTVLDCINLFLEDSTKLIDDLSQAITDINFEKVAAEAHKLKGSSANMGAARLPEFSQNLINFAKEENLSSASLSFRQISDEYKFITSVYLSKKETYENSIRTVKVS